MDIIHRDMKVEHILVDEDGFIKIIDFGEARIIDQQENLKDSICSTYEYSSPESILK